jgi:hypothetical protein
MVVTLSNASVAAIIIIVISAGVAAGIFHDQSIKTLYQSFSTQSAQDATLNSQNQQLQNQLRELQGLPKVTLVSGVITKYGAAPVYIFFDAQSGPSLSSGVVSDTSLYQYQYQVYLGTGLTYGVRIYYSSTFGGTQSCAGVPVIIQPLGTTYTQDFNC